MRKVFIFERPQLPHYRPLSAGSGRSTIGVRVSSFDS